MSSRSSILLFLVFAGTAATSFAACSSETTVVEASDAGNDAAKPSTPKSDAGGGSDAGGTETRDECLAACETKHAAGLTKDKAIDTCWAQSCKAPCIDGTGTFDAGTVDAGDDAGDGGDAGAGQCKNGVETGDQACNDCTSAFCCGAWDGCFDDQDCADLNDCRSACPDQ